MPATPPEGAAPATRPAGAQGQSDAERKQAASLAAQKQVDLLNQERKWLENELYEYVLKPMSEKELILGRTGDMGDHGATLEAQYSGLQQEKLRLASEIGRSRAELNELEGQSADGKTPPGVEVQVMNNPRAADLGRRVDEMAARLDDLKAKEAGDGKASGSNELSQAERRLKAAEVRLDEVTQHLRTVYLADQKEQLRGRVREGEANLSRVEQMINETGGKIGQLRQELAEYHWLQHKEQHLRARLEYLNDRIDHMRMYDVEGIPDPAPLGPAAQAQP